MGGADAVRTARASDARASAWTSRVKLRVSPRMTTSEGIALRAPSVTISVQETTAVSAGWMLRATIVCSPRTIWAATTMGSTTICGWEACPPRPAMRISKLSSLDMRLPDPGADAPGGHARHVVQPEDRRRRGTGRTDRRRSSPWRRSPCSSAGWKTSWTAPSKPPSPARTWPAPSTMAMCPSWPQACIVPSCRDRYGSVAALGQRQPVHVGAQPDRPAAAVLLPQPWPPGRCRRCRGRPPGPSPTARRPGSRWSGARRGRSRGSGAGRAASRGAGPPGPRALHSCDGRLVGRAGKPFLPQGGQRGVRPSHCCDATHSST